MEEEQKPTSILEDLTIEEGSLVDKGDNPGAHIMLFKMKKDQEKTETLLQKLARWVKFGKDEHASALTMQEIIRDRDYMDEFYKLKDAFSQSISSILDYSEGQEMVDKLRETVDQFSNSAMDLADRIYKNDHQDHEKIFQILSDLKTAIDGDGAIDRGRFAKAAAQLDQIELTAPEKADHQTEEEEEKTEMEKEELKTDLPVEDPQVEKSDKTDVSEIQKQMQAMKSELEQARETVAKLENERNQAAYIAKAREMAVPGVEVSEMAEIVKAADMNKETGEKILNVINALASQVKAKDNLLFKSIGSAGTSDPNSASVRLENAAREIQTSKNISYAQAYDEAMTANPELAAEAIQG